jgi:adenine-specific DNA methylase
MDQPPYEMDGRRRQIVLDAIREVARYRGWRLFAVHVRTTQVHVVVAANDTPERVMNDFKAYATRHLNESKLDPEGRKRWARHSSTPYIWKQKGVEAAVHCVLDEQGEPMAVFDGTRQLDPSREGPSREGDRAVVGDGSAVDRSLTRAAPFTRVPSVEFEIFEPKSESQVRSGTVNRGNATCPCCNTVLPVARVRAQLAAQRGGADVIFERLPPSEPLSEPRPLGSGTPPRTGGARLLAVVTLDDNQSGRQYRLPSQRDYEAVWKAQKRLRQILEEWEQPIVTERYSRVRARGSAALAASVHLVCRPRPENAGTGGWEEILRQLPKRIGDWMKRLSTEGIRGADLVFSCIGPALELFSKYEKVETAEGREVKLPEFLEKVWEVVG